MLIVKSYCSNIKYLFCCLLCCTTLTTVSQFAGEVSGLWWDPRRKYLWRSVCWGVTGCYRHVTKNGSSRSSLPSSKNPHFHNEAKCKTVFVKMSLICMRMKNHFHIKGWAFNLVLILSPLSFAHNTSCLPLKILHKRYFRFLSARLSYRRGYWKQCLYKNVGESRVKYGHCEVANKRLSQKLIIS